MRPNDWNEDKMNQLVHWVLVVRAVKSKFLDESGGETQIREMIGVKIQWIRCCRSCLSRSLPGYLVEIPFYSCDYHKNKASRQSLIERRMTPSAEERTTRQDKSVKNSRYDNKRTWETTKSRPERPNREQNQSQNP